MQGGALKRTEGVARRGIPGAKGTEAPPHVSTLDPQRTRGHSGSGACLMSFWLLCEHPLSIGGEPRLHPVRNEAARPLPVPPNTGSLWTLGSANHGPPGWHVTCGSQSDAPKQRGP